MFLLPLDLIVLCILFVIYKTSTVAAVRVCGFGAEREVDAQIWWTFDGLQGSMDGLASFTQAELGLRVWKTSVL